MKQSGLTLIFLLNWLLVSAQVFDVDTLQYSGNIDNRINLVILSDGYQQHELTKFVDDAKVFSESFFAERPFAEYQSFFNVFIIKVPSRESGASHPGSASDVTEPVHPVNEVDNYFGSAFDSYGIHRLLVPTNSAAITNVLAANFPSYDQVLILVNSPFYGGSGGQYATASLHSSSSEIAIHEIGHSFTGLKDEYFAGDGYLSEAINMTQETDPAKVKWKNWVGHQEVGIYQHCCGGNSSAWYRPHESCKMRYLNSPFCSVCVEGTVERIHSFVSVVDDYMPKGTVELVNLSPVKFNLALIKSAPKSIKIKWELNGKEIESDKESVELSHDKFKKGDNILFAIVEDNTLLVRKENHPEIHSRKISWNIRNNLSDNARLSGLSLEEIKLNPAFTSETTAYTATTGHSVELVKISASAENKDASLSINGNSAATGTASGSVALKEGKNTITIKVTSQDAAVTKTYTVEVKRESPPKVAPEITFSQKTLTYSPASFNLSATSNSGGAITYEIAEELSQAYPGDVTLSGTGNGTVNVVKSGKVRLRAKVAENDKFLPGSAETDLVVNKAAAKVTVNEVVKVYDGTPQAVAVVTEPAGLKTDIFYKGSATLPVAAGEYEVQAVIKDNNYAGEDGAIFTIKKATAKVNITGLSQEFDGKPKAVNVSTEPEGLKTDVLYNGSATVPVAPGEYQVRAVVTGENYTGESVAVLKVIAPSADLSALTVEGFVLSPVFSPAVSSYDIIVGQEVSAVKISAAAKDSQAGVAINGTNLSGHPVTTSVPLKEGINTIVVKVTAKDGSATKNYYVEVMRENAPAKTAPKLTFANRTESYSPAGIALAATSNSGGAISYEIVEELSQEYPGDVTLSGHGNAMVTVVKCGKVRLKARVAEDDQHLPGSAEMDLVINKAPAKVTITDLTHEYSGAPKAVVVTTEPAGLEREISYNGSVVAPVAPGRYEVSSVIVSNLYAGEASAVLTINEPSAELTALKAGNLNLSPAFSSASFKYSATAAYSVASVKVFPTPKDPLAKLTVNGSSIAAGGAGSAVPLQEGNNVIEVKVTSQGGFVSKIYAINIFKEAAPAKTPPQVTFSSTAGTYNPAGLTLAAKTNSTGAISYEIVEELTPEYPGDVSLDGPGNGILTVVKSGKVLLRANVAEDENFLAQSADMEFLINKAKAVVNIGNLVQEYNGEPKSVEVITEPAGIKTEVFYNGTSEVPEAAGEHKVLVVIEDENYEGEAAAVLTIRIPTAVSQAELVKNISLYPNPTRNKAILEFQEGTRAMVKVLDLSGRFINQETVSGKYEVNLENRAAGTYLIMVKAEGKAPVYLKLQKH